MADDIIETTATSVADGNGTGGDDITEVAKLRKEKDNAFRLLRDRDVRLQQVTARISEIDDLKAEIAALKQANKGPTSTSMSPVSDGEPDIETDPTGWLKWSRRQDQAERDRVQRESAAQNESLNLNTFALSAETAAKTEHPDYDKALNWLRDDYRKELEDSGELQEAALAALNDPNQKRNIEQHALSKGITEFDAALDLCAVGAFEWRRQQIVKSARRTGANPAVKAYEMAKKRAKGTPWADGAADTTTARTATQVDASLAEMERKRNLRSAEQSLSETRGSEPHDKRVWTRRELEDLRQNNPKEFKRAIVEIAQQADAGDPRDVLGNLITR